MRLVDAAAEILQRHPGEALSVRQLARRAVEEGLISPKSESPWFSMAAAMNKELRARKSRNEAPRFISAGKGLYRHNSVGGS